MIRKMKTIVWCGIIILTFGPWVFAQENSGTAGQAEVLTLENCLELASENSPDLKAASKSVQIAETAVEEAKAGFRPKLDYTVFANAAEEPIYPNSVYRYISQLSGYASTEMSGASIALTQPLYTGGKLTAALQLAEAQLKIAAANEKKAKQQLTFQVKQYFYQVWLSGQILKVAQASYDNLEEHVRKINEFYKAGTVSKYETLRAAVQRDSLKPQVIAAQNGVKIAKLSLATTIGLAPDRQYTVNYNLADLKLPEQSQVVPAAVLTKAYRERPEIQQIKAVQLVCQLQLNLAAAGYRPNVALVGQYQAGSTDYQPSNWWDNGYWSCTLSVTGNLYNGGATPAKVKGATENVELADVKETKLRDQIRLEVEQAAQSITESLETVWANQSNIDLAQKSLELTQTRFEAGMATTMDVMDAQLVEDQALNGYYRGIALYLTAAAKLDLAQGSGI